ncbi:hypothetical protein JCGZ_00644 [Jatropha curcas]|uniref:Uncharacterized protein n=1 Tax=Jatropha curcas TaxID=180498 RepID=A0A067JDF3_JATCU|nr:hypothetical protein JCGZ_00644 [Jatropha curcas]
MQKVQSPLNGDHKLRPKCGRTPLQPKNLPSNPVTEIQILKPKPKQKQERIIEISVDGELNKENHPISVTTPTKLIIEQLDASLAEELSAIRKKLERMKVDRERTKKMLNERAKTMDLQMKELEQRGEVQKRLEIEVDRLFRLKELQSGSMRISPIRSLREKEHEKKIAHLHWQEMKAEDMEESASASGLKTPCLSSSSSSNSISSSHIVAVK